MIRPACCTTVAALSTCHRTFARSFHSSASRRDREWGLLRRKSDPDENSVESIVLKKRRSSEYEQPLGGSRRRAEHLTHERASAQLRRAQSTTPRKRPSSQDDTGKELEMGATITIYGLSPRLHSKDFHRIFPPGLSTWSDQITKVQQLRNSRTLEPTGAYVLTFPSASAAAAYRSLLTRLHGLSKLKVSSKNGLWESAVPDHLRQGCDNKQLNELERQSVVVPGSVEQIQFSRDDAEARRGGRWHAKLDAISETHGWNAQGRNTIVLMQTYPPGLGEDEVEQMLSKDDTANSLAWDVSKPVQLRSKLDRQQAERESEDCAKESPSASGKKQPDKGLGRFLLAFADVSEAQTFNRRWNHRLVEVQGERELHRCLIHTSIIET